VLEHNAEVDRDMLFLAKHSGGGPDSNFATMMRYQRAESLQLASSVILAAPDEITQHRCICIIRAASKGKLDSSIQDISAAVALTCELIDMKSLPAVNTVLATLDKVPAKSWDAKSLKDAGFPGNELLQASVFSLRELTFAGCITECSIVRLPIHVACRLDDFQATTRVST
jgi:hypothetical protein